MEENIQLTTKNVLKIRIYTWRNKFTNMILKFSVEILKTASSLSCTVGLKFVASVQKHTTLFYEDDMVAQNFQFIGN